MTRCVIIGGADINNYELVKKHLRSDDFVVCCDSGLSHCKMLGINPDLAIGDFDSHIMPKGVDVIKLPCEKDDTDTFAAVKAMLDKGYKKFLILGVIGNRFDHTMGNISILFFLSQNKANGVIIDDFGEISLLENGVTIEVNECKYFSVIALETIKNICISGAKYPLNNAEILPSWQYGISNEPLKKTKITFEKGNGLLIKIY